MKNILLSIIVTALALMARNATATTITNGGALTISWTITHQLETNTLVSSTTNHSNTGTNIVSNYKATTAKSTLANAAFLNLLANSFKTTFAAGTQLATDKGGSVYVVDKTGTNVVLTISSVVTVESTISPPYSASYSSTVTVPKSGVTTTNINGSETLTTYLTLKYNDSSQTTSDGTHSSFQFSAVSTTVEDVKNNNGKGNFTAQDGAGTGTIRGIFSLISQGTYSGSFTFTAN